MPGHPPQGPLERVYRAALALGTANQLTNILRDVGEDASQRNRIYVPLDELAAFKIREEEVCWWSCAVFSSPCRLAAVLLGGALPGISRRGTGAPPVPALLSCRC